MRDYATTYYKIILGVFLATGLMSCSKEDKIPDDAFIRFLTSIEQPDPRISETNFDPDDRIGVFVVPYVVGNTTPGILGESDYANNIEHIYRGGSWVTENGNYLPWPGGRNIDVYAYYPYDVNLSDPRNYSFRVSTDQSGIAQYQASDFLYARNLAVSQSSNVPLVFSHQLSKVNINIRSEFTAVNESVDQTFVYIEQIIPGCVIDLADGTVDVNSSGSREGITALKLDSPVADFDLSLTAVIPPQSISSATRLLRINNRGINYFYTTTEEIVFRQGYSMTFNIEITEQGIIVTTGTVSEWNDGGVISGNIGNRLPRIFDLDAINWDESYVYYIYDGNILIGQVCREYLSRNVTPQVDLPAIVVYPLGTDGRMDLTKGFVARVYNRTRNSSNRYEFNTGNVHGGRAVFAPKDTLYTYTQGGLPLVNKVRIESTDDINAAADNAMSFLSLRPHTVTDVDNNTYAVTKIGTQYWTRENYKVEHYANGQSLEYFYYNNDSGYKNQLGAYYRWATVVTEGFTPEDWRVPNRDDWNSLYHYVNPQTGRKIKALDAWNTSGNADDVTGFAGLPAGRRTAGGGFSELNNYGQWWSSTASSTTEAWRIYVGDGTAITENSLNQNYGESVRLMRDN